MNPTIRPRPEPFPVEELLKSFGFGFAQDDHKPPRNGCGEPAPSKLASEAADTGEMCILATKKAYRQLVDFT